MKQEQLIPHLFRTEYRKIVAVLCSLFGFDHVEIAEDIASDTFLKASETWSQQGLPENAVGWLYTVAKNKARNHLKHNKVFSEKINATLITLTPVNSEPDIDLSDQNIKDSQLQMIFAVCHPCISSEAQVSLALKILCGFGVNEIADAFFSNKETINKRIYRAKEKLKAEKIQISLPPDGELNNRLATVLTTLYLLFNEGYYSQNYQSTVRKDLCFEAIRLAHLLLENPSTNKPPVNALLSLMYFQSSRLEARTGQNGDVILYDDQDEQLWDSNMITLGVHFLSEASQGDTVSKYHFEAGIAHWHTQKNNTIEKWENILQLYNYLLIMEYSPTAALNRTYALARARGKAIAIVEAEKLKLTNMLLYHALLGDLYCQINDDMAIFHFETAVNITKSIPDIKILNKKIEQCKNNLTAGML